jgi:predicted O-methyltransferase YrrM
MNSVLEKILEDRSYTFKDGSVLHLHSHTPKNQCEFLQKIIKNNRLKASIEIGFAFGTSTLAICETIKENGGTKHVVIDKFENSHWGGSGLQLANEAGYESFLDFKEDFCYLVLPTLVQKGNKFDFAYIDSVKEFDWILNNFFYLDKLLMPGGIIILDDVVYPGVRKVARFINRLPHYEILDQHPENTMGAKHIVSKVLSILPFKEKLFRNDLLNSDYSLGINCRCVAFRKVKEDYRNWDWFSDF